ncbi:MAG: NADP-dependent oxidoreductase [Gammaproteobacteria bacterium]|nr:NADP-dependent oxidoreductase [Gammaproteobacteria bacterium]MYH86847.1 NADP-dependent oxidoreductase [Gammaproteobacteria bacterium]MYK04970.1 NADP-dependent oxidoreductase [Gammaproteobacteria bacterium]
MSKNRQIVLVKKPEGVPTPDNFELRQAPLPEMPAGGVLCRARFLSLDPYMRSQIAGRHPSGTVAPGEVMLGETVSEVVRSDAPELPAGRLVRCMGGWQEYSAHAAGEAWLLDEEITPPCHPSLALSILGMTGLTAWAGMVWQAEVREGDCVLIPAVTGAVGSAAAQFCALRGARVIGIAGSPEKCRFATESLGVAACIDRRSEDIGEKLGELCPAGIDVYFDLIGGSLLQTACSHLANHGRIVLCGLMAEYNRPERDPGPPPGLLIAKRAVVSGLVVYDFEARRTEYIRNCLPLLRTGKIHQREDISHGLESAPDAFCRLMLGKNFGKTIVAL